MVALTITELVCIIQLRLKRSDRIIHLRLLFCFWQCKIRVLIHLFVGGFMSLFGSDFKLKVFCFTHPLQVVLVFGNLLVQNLVRKTVLINAVDEISPSNMVYSSLTTMTNYRLLSEFTVLHYFFKPQHFVLTNYVKSV